MNKPAGVSWLVTLILAMGMLSRAQGQAEVTPRAELQRAYDEAIGKWRSHKPATYEFTVAALCFCGISNLHNPTFRVDAAGAPHPSEAVSPDLERFYEPYDTIDKIFNVLKSYIDRDPYRMRVEYDLELGYPRTADIDPRQFVADDELGLRVTNFKVSSK